MKKIFSTSILWVIVSSLALACNAATATPTLAPTATATASPAPTGTPTSAPTSTATPLPAPTPSRHVERDVTYCTTDGIALKMDLFFPNRADTQIAPVAINIHGGSWSFGDKTQSENQPEVDALAAHGYVVAAVNYRLAPAHKFPAQIEDVKCAVRYLRANATRYHLDPHHIGAFGCSAGGHLAAMLGVTDVSAGFDSSGDYRDQSSRAQAIVTLSAPFDLALVDMNNAERARTMQRVFGAPIPNDPIFTRVSPIHYVSKDDPPFLILQADNDGLVPLVQPTRFYERLRGVNVPATLIVAQNATHCLPANDAMFPSRAQITQSIIGFFDHYLR